MDPKLTKNGAKETPIGPQEVKWEQDVEISEHKTNKNKSNKRRTFETLI